MCRSSTLKRQYFRNLITILFFDEYRHKEYSSVSELKKKDIRSSHREMLSRNRCSLNSILDFDNKLMEGTKRIASAICRGEFSAVITRLMSKCL